MKLRTSFFNGTALKKDITRFFPVWGIYTVFVLLAVVLLYENKFYSSDEMFALVGVMNLGYGGICALTLFGDLFVPRLCNALHAMPMRREGWFLTHFAAGMLFCIVPNLAGAVLAACLMGQVVYLPFLWLLVAVLTFALFFSLGIFSVVCAGNRLGALAMYGILNFLAVLVAWMVDTFYAPALPGVVLDLSFLSWVCPVVQLSQLEFIDLGLYKPQGLVLHQIYWQDFGYVAILAAVGLVFLVLSVLVYRKRKLESAGDLLSLKPVFPVFLVLYTLSVGAFFYLSADLFGGDVAVGFLVVGLVVGFFTGCMLLEKRVKIFRKKRFVQFAILLVVFFGTIGITKLDPAGVTRYVPEAEAVKSVSVSPYHSGEVVSFVTDNYIYQRDALHLTEQEDIANIIGVHNYCIDNSITAEPILSGGGYVIYKGDEGGTPLTITYTLKNGRVVQRCYQVSLNSPAGKTLKPYFSAASYVLDTDNVQDLLQRVEYLEYYGNKTNDICLLFKSGQANNARIEDEGDMYNGKTITYLVAGDLSNSPEAVALFGAMVADCEEGTLAQLWDYHSEVVGNISLQYRDDAGILQYMDITIYSDSAHSADLLKDLIGQ